MLARLQIRRPRLALATILLAAMGCAARCAAADHPAADRSTLYGDVTDPAGFPIRNARIFLIQNSTRAKLQTWTNEEGNFVFPQLAPDSYTLQAIQTGFAPVQIPAIALHASENRGVDIHFQISRPQETAIIHAGEFEEASVISTRIGHDLTDILPINGPTLQPLLLLTPGVVLMANNEFSFNGQATNMNYFTVDGASVNLAVKEGAASADLGQDAAHSALGTTSNLISLDSLDEFSVRSSTISPMIGRQSGGHVQLTSRSGGEAYHGEGFELFRNSALDAQDWFTATDTAVNTNLRQNDFGGIFSGPMPVAIKWIGRNYFFLSEESLRLLQPTSFDTYVPSNNLRAQAAPKLLPFLNVFPTSSLPDPGTGTSRYRLGISNPSLEDNYALRFDSRQNPRLEGFARYSHSASSRVSTDTGWALSSVGRRSQNLTVGLLWKLHTHFANDLRLNFSENSGTLINSLHKLGGATIPPENVLLQGISSKFKMPSLNYDFLGVGYASKSTGYQPVHQINVTDSMLLERGSTRSTLVSIICDWWGARFRAIST
ncbi:MAG TPA: carboxypeptidase-like regulatory domain-containing protein [Terracidiphilus sp.]|nr:carboxypeptidase-like regulatory domain-containing protein [Terracidiphilus sp.]